jgi:predicted transcriptional regulator
MFAMIGGGDKAGSGGDVILKGWRESNWRTPYLAERSRPDIVDLYLPLESVLADSVKDELNQLYGSRVFSLDHNSLIILAMATQTDVTNEMLQYYMDVHRTDITKLLRSLCRAGYLEAIGVGRATKYHLCRGEQDMQNTLNETNQETFVIGTDTKVDTKACTKAHTKVPECNTSENKTISNIQKEEIKAQFDKNSVIKEVKMFCSKWRKTAEIAEHLGMNPAYVSGYIIKNMLECGLLIREYPDSPKHPGQRYKTKPKSQRS